MTDLDGALIKPGANLHRYRISSNSY